MAKFTTQQLTDLRAAIATGALSVDTPSMRTTFRSQDEMLKLERIMAEDIAGASTATQATSYASYSKD